MTDHDAVSQAAGSAPKGHQTAWISHGLEELIHDIGAQTSSREGCDFDVIIVGSGYGGAVAAAGLAGCTHNGHAIKICVLERGKEYLPGMFPQRMADLASHVRFVTEGKACPRGEREGLFDVRVGADVCAVVANGLGGGSLINAGVMEEPLANVFEHGWPAAITLESLRPCYDQARRMLGAVIGEKGETKRNTIAEHPDGVPAKFAALERLATSGRAKAKPFRATAITVAMTDKESSSGVALKQCVRCGDCATGCNHQAKDSLDVNLLVTAARADARIYTGATVLKIERTKEVTPGPGTAYIDVAPDTRDTEPTVWTLDVVHTEARLRARQGPPFRITARKVILAAGTFGSTEILMRSQTETLKFSQRLGQRFSTNGDMIAVAYDQHIEIDGKRRDVNAAADETKAPRSRAVGPTITGIIDLRGAGDCDLVVEELAVPGPLARLFDETVAMGNLLQGLARADTDAHKPAGPPHDPCAVDRQAMRRSSIVALMGDDDAAGALELVGDDDERNGDGALRVRWPGIHKHPLFPAQIDALRTLARESATRGEILPNPLWQLLPDKMQMLLDNKRGPLLTVHPLGGCPMADVVHDGVVDPLGRVFDGRFATISRELPGLVVLDGSIVPVALRINPSLTIAALALRAIDGLRTAWDYAQPAKTPRKHEIRPVFLVPDEHPQAPRRTEVEFVERMSGAVTIAGKGGGAVRCVVELTLWFGRVALADLILPGNDGRVPMKRTLHVEKGMLRVFRKAAWEAWRVRGGHDDELGGLVEIQAPLTGELDFLHREATTQDERQCRALRAWFVNRGLRDVVQEVITRLTDGSKLPSDLFAYLRGRWRDLKALASHAGEVRQFEYRLAVGDLDTVAPNTPIDAAAFERRRTIGGRKRFTYARSSNPWRQLSQMTLETFPGLAEEAPPVLELDTNFLAQERIPLMRIVKQQDEPSALADLASFGAYFVRLLLSVHVWSFRRPDAAEPREPQRLPGMVDGLPAPVIRELDLGAMKDGRPVRVRLTRYPRLDSDKPPVVMIHGYSASGTTFAHPAVDPNLARYLWERKRDVWILDLRTSSGMPTARYPWAFEEVALADLPAAFDYIYREAGRKKLDIFAHCMGSAMFSMALLAPPASGDAFFRERDALPGIIHRVVLSQIGPVVVFSPANIFRAYLMSYLRNFLPLANYEFRVGPDPSLTDQLIDRFLAAMPYPEKEFSLENPFWPPWRRTPFVGTRHRMDALYGRDFNLENIDDRVLDYVDDLFGPLSIDTVSQAINFARLEVITSRAGRNEYVSRDNFLRRWRVDDKDIPTLSIHGSDNGLADVATLARMKKLLVDDLGFENYETHAFAGFGHQDSLIGRNAGEVFAVVHEFLDRE